MVFTRWLAQQVSLQAPVTKPGRRKKKSVPDRRSTFLERLEARLMLDSTSITSDVPPPTSLPRFEPTIGSVDLNGGLVYANQFGATSSQRLATMQGDQLLYVSGPLTSTDETPSEGDSTFVGPLLMATVSSVQDPTEGGDDGYFRVTRPTTLGALRVHYQVVEAGTSTSEYDFARMPGSVVIEDGQNSADIRIHATDDDIPENNETLSLVLIGTDNAQYIAGTTTHHISVTDNDTAGALPVVSIVQTADANEGGAPGLIELQRFGSTDAELSVVLTLEQDQSSADQEADLGGLSTDSTGSTTQMTVVFPAGEAVLSLSLPAVDDSDVEGFEWLSVAVAPSSSGTYIADRVASVYVNIVDNDQPAEPPVISNLIHVDDAEDSSTDASFDIRVTGVAASDSPGETLRLEFDHGNNNTIDGSLTVISGQPFLYDPSSIDETLASQLDTFLLRVRAVAIEADGTDGLVGLWESLVIRMEQPVTSGPPRLEDLGLLHDTDVRDDGITVNSTLTGTILGDLAGGSATVQFDHDGDGVVDGSVSTTVSGETWTYDPRAGDATLADHAGPLTIQYRVVFEADSEASAGDWESITYTLVEAPPAASSVGTLTHSIGRGETEAWGITISGTVDLPDAPAANDSNAPTPSYPGATVDPPMIQTGADGISIDELLPPQADYVALFTEVEIDLNQDGSVDATTFADTDGVFQIQLPGLGTGTHVVRARTREWDVNVGTNLESPWSEYTFTWQAEPAPSIFEVLWRQDPLASGIDEDIAAVIAGRVDETATNADELTVEFDFDGDGAGDGVTYVGSDGTFEYRLPTIEFDIDSVDVRTVRWDVAAGEEVVGDWSSFSLVESDASSETTTEVVGPYPNTNTSSGYSSTSQTVSPDSSTTASPGNSSASGEGSAAQQQYDDAVEAATTAYDNAMAIADSDFQSAIASFGGNTTFFNFEKLTWPDAPARNSLQLPTDDSQPTAPELPNYQDTPYNLVTDSTYQSAVGAVRSTYNSATQTAESNRDGAIQTANSTFDSDRQQAESDYQDALQAAEDAYNQALQQEPSPNLQDAATTYNSQVQAANNAYNSTLESLGDALQAAIEGLQDTLNAAIDTAYDNYSNTVEPAWDAYVNVVSNPNGCTCDQQRSAWITYAQAEHAARKTLENDISTARHDFDAAAGPVYRDHSKQVADAVKTRSQALSAAMKQHDDAVTNFEYAKKVIKINATVTLLKAKAEALKTRDQTIANHRETLDKAVAQADRDYAIAIANAETALWQGEATAKANALSAWDLSESTAWSAYQLALAVNAVSHVTQLATAHVNHVTATANATKQRADAVATATKTHTRDIAEEAWERARDIADAKGTFWHQAAIAQRDYSLNAAAERDTLRMDAADADHARDHQNADDYYAHAIAYSDAYHAYVTAMVNARQLIVSPATCSNWWTGWYGYGYGWGWGWYGWWTYEKVSIADSVNNSTTFTKATQTAGHDLQIATINTNETWTRAHSDITEAYENNVSDEAKTKSNKLAGDLKIYHEKLADIEHDYAVAVVQIDGVETTTLTTQDVTWTQIVAPADKSFADQQIGFTGTHQVADANSEKTFRINAAADFASEAAAWHATTNTPWSAYYVALGTVEGNWALASGTALVTFATATATADSNRTASASQAERDLRVGNVLADQAHTSTAVSSRNTYATTAAAAKRVYAKAIAGFAKTKNEAANDQQNADGNADNSADHSAREALAAAESAYQRAMADASLPLSHTSADANGAFSIACGEAWEDVYMGNSDPEDAETACENAMDTYNSTMEPAYQAYDSAAHAAWDAVRTARAAHLRAQIELTGGSETQSAALAADDLAFTQGSGNAAKTLATAIKNASIALATTVSNIDKTLAAAVAGNQQTYRNAVAQADRVFDNAAAAAQATRRVGDYVAGAAQREDRIAVRGLYEVASYNQYATDQANAATASGTDLAAFQALVASADAVWANANRIARDAYEDAISIAGYNHIVTVTNADVARTTAATNASFAFAQSSAAADYGHNVANANAAADMYLANATAEAIAIEQDVFANVDYDIARATAFQTLQDALAASATTWTSDRADAYEQYYLDATDDWAAFTYTPAEYWGYWGWGGWGGGGWWGGWYGGYGFGGYGWGGWYGYGWGYGGYSYGGWYGGYGWWGYGWGGYGFGGWGYGMSSWYGWGYAYGWGYGYGWGGYYVHDQAAWDALQEDLEDINEARESANEPLELAYVTAVGDAQIARATSLGDTKIQLATARGNAGVNHASAVNSAESSRQSTLATAAQTRTSNQADADKTFADTVADAQRTQINAENLALVNVRTLEGNIAATRAGAVANAEADYQIAAATSDANSKNADFVANPTPQTQFDAAYADAKRQWITALKPAFVTHAVNSSLSDGQLALDLANIQKTQNAGHANADYFYATTASTQERTRANTSLTPANALESTLLGLDLGRRTQHVNLTKTHEIDTATILKQFAIDEATIEKQYQIDRVNEVEGWADARKQALADRRIQRDTQLADATLAWQQPIIVARKSYTLSEAAANLAFAQTIANVEFNYSDNIAIAERARRDGYANVDEIFWNNETAARNAARANHAITDVALWTAEETFRVPAHGVINSWLGTPWSQYIADVAGARLAWWTSVTPTYYTYIADQNIAEGIYQLALTAALKTEANFLAAADKNRSVAIATAQRSQALDHAQALRDYFANLAGPVETYANAIAQADRTYAVAVATARHNEDYSGIEMARMDRDQAHEQAKETYSSAELNRHADLIVDQAQADRDAAIDMIAADVARVNSRENIELTRETAEANAYLVAVQNRAGIESVYLQYEANTIAAAVNAFASSYVTPWSLYEAVEKTAFAIYTAAVAPATATFKSANAWDQATAEVTQANADATFTINARGNRAAWETTNADATLAQEQDRAASLFGMSGSSDQAPVPNVDGPQNTVDDYTVQGAPTSHFIVTFTTTSTQNGFSACVCWLWGAWGWWGGWGYWPWNYGSYGYGGSLGGYGGGYSGGEVELVEPAEPNLPGNFWEVGAEANSVQTPNDNYIRRYELFARGSGLVAEPVDVSFNGGIGGEPESTPPPPMPEYDFDEVVEILMEMNELLADFWESHGKIVRDELPARPGTEPAAEANPTNSQGLAAAEFSKLAASTFEGDSRFNEQVWVVAPDEWQSGRVAKLIYDVTLGDAWSERTSALRAQFQAYAQPYTSEMPGDELPEEEPDENNPAPEPYDEQQAIQMKLGSFNPEDVPREKINQLTREGKMVKEAKFIGRQLHVAAAAPLTLSDGTRKILVIEYVPMGWFTPDRWRVVGVAPSTYSIARALDVYIWSPREAAAAQSAAAMAEFVLHVIPLGAAADEFSQGNYKEAAISFAGDVAMLLTGGASKVLSTTRAATKLGVTAKHLRTAGLVTEAGIAGIRGLEGGIKLWNGKGGAGEIAEAILRLFGVKFAIGSKVDDAVKVARSGVVAKVASHVADDASKLAKRIMCFVPDTIVATARGDKSIRSVETGEFVQAFNFSTGKWELAEVLQRHDNEYSGEMVAVTIGQDRVEATARHPFWVVEGENLQSRRWPEHLEAGQDERQSLPGRWVDSHDLRPGDLVQGRDGERRRVTRIELWRTKSTPVCNLTIRDHHTFAVGTTGTLVHNTGWCNFLTDHGDEVLRTKYKAAQATLEKLYKGISIHGHHIVQKYVPKVFSTKKIDGKLIKDFAESDIPREVNEKWTKTDIMSWYIGQSQEILKKLKVPIYGATDFKTTEKAFEAAEKASKAGKKIHNLTLAPNDKITHSIETVREVWQRLEAAKHSKKAAENALDQLSELFLQGTRVGH